MVEQDIGRRERERLRHRQLILDTGLELFAEKGYYSVTMSEIAEKAEFATGTLYKFFESKQEIYEAIILETACKIVGRLTETVSGEGGPEALVKAYISELARLTSEALPVVRLLMAESEGIAGSHIDGVGRKVREQIDKLEGALAGLMARGMAEGVFREADPLFLAICLESLNKSYMIRRLYERNETVGEEDVEELFKFFMRGAGRQV